MSWPMAISDVIIMNISDVIITIISDGHWPSDVESVKQAIEANRFNRKVQYEANVSTFWRGETLWRKSSNLIIQSFHNQYVRFNHLKSLIIHFLFIWNHSITGISCLLNQLETSCYPWGSFSVSAIFSHSNSHPRMFSVPAAAVRRPRHRGRMRTCHSISVFHKLSDPLVHINILLFLKYNLFDL